MGFGKTAKKLQTLTETATKMYRRLNTLREVVESIRKTLESLRTTAESTHKTVDAAGKRLEAVESELAEQRVLIEALVEAQGVDAEQLIADSEVVDQNSEANESSAHNGETPTSSDERDNNKASTNADNSADSSERARDASSVELPEEYIVLSKMAANYEGDEIHGSMSGDDIRRFLETLPEAELSVLKQQAIDDMQ